MRAGRRELAPVSYTHLDVYKRQVKDTIKIVDTSEFAEETPDRSRVWLVQTPQAFENLSLIHI